jgi:hypothetical protein
MDEIILRPRPVDAIGKRELASAGSLQFIQYALCIRIMHIRLVLDHSDLPRQVEPNFQGRIGGD